jgi:AraC family transcriptional regulator of arabinose operon
MLDNQAIDAGHYRWGPGRVCGRDGGSDDWHLIYSMSGAGMVRSGGVEVAMPPGRLALYAPGTPQFYATAPGRRLWQRIWVHVHPPTGWLDLLAWPECSPGLRTLDVPADTIPDLTAALQRMVAAVKSGEPHGERLALNALEHALLLIAAASARNRIDPRLTKALSGLEADLSRPWAVSSLAALAGLSSAQFTRLCSRLLGESPHRLIERRRLEEAARRLVHGDDAIAAIGAAVGYAEHSHFTNRFRARYGFSPVAWRSRHSGETLTLRTDPEHLPPD